mmetsp:Transcript_30111/g.69482  ORF Transcript_30111/g.69482 Transcript_30111/m.69482 type:complete len:87 (-) Transcript_30111:27-287(-)
MITVTNQVQTLSDIAKVQHQPTRPRKYTYNPVMSAMLSGNQMQSCDHVRQFYSQCLASKSKASICTTASKYFAVCVSQGEIDADDL